MRIATGAVGYVCSYLPDAYQLTDWLMFCEIQENVCIGGCDLLFRLFRAPLVEDLLLKLRKRFGKILSAVLIITDQLGHPAGGATSGA